MSLKVSKINARGEWSSTQAKSTQTFFKHHEVGPIVPHGVSFLVIKSMFVPSWVTSQCVVMF
jgi:hypothetical protein